MSKNKHRRTQSNSEVDLRNTLCSQDDRLFCIETIKNGDVSLGSHNKSNNYQISQNSTENITQNKQTLSQQSEKELIVEKLEDDYILQNLKENCGLTFGNAKQHQMRSTFAQYQPNNLFLIPEQNDLLSSVEQTQESGKKITQIVKQKVQKRSTLSVDQKNDSEQKENIKSEHTRQNSNLINQIVCNSTTKQKAQLCDVTHLVNKQKLQIPNSKISPFITSTRVQNHYSDIPSTSSRSFINDIGPSTTITPNKISQCTFKDSHHSNIQNLVAENIQLNQEVEKLQNELFQYQNQNQSFVQLKEQLNNLQKLSQGYQKELEEWKQKYNKAATAEKMIKMQQMEFQLQVINVFQENEKLKQSISTIEIQLKQSEQKQSIIIQQYENELKKLKDIINQSSIKQTINEKTLQKNNSSIINKFKMNDQENNIRKKSDPIQNDVWELQQQIINLTFDNKILHEKLEEVKKNKISHSKVNNFSKIKHEISNQQIIMAEEIKKLKNYLTSKQKSKNELQQAYYLLKNVIESENNNNIFSDKTIEELQNSQNNCLRIIQQLQE